MKKPATPSPAVPVHYELADVDAIQALERGDADEHQQKRALLWIVNVCAGAYEFHYYPSDRDTAFALGRAFSGQQIVKMCKLNLSAMRRVENG